MQPYPASSDPGSARRPFAIEWHDAAPVVVNANSHLPALDGLRGLMTIFVVMSHYFGEVAHGLSVFCVGWVAVHMFFVLSGFLVGRLVIRKRKASNFLPVFLLRRATRTLPVYFVCCLIIMALLALFGARDWTHSGEGALPMWSYLLMVQNIVMFSQAQTGQSWLAPTWTLALEEQFYLFAPWLFMLLPRRAWLPALALTVLGGLLSRIAVLTIPAFAGAPMSLLPTYADVFALGLLVAVLNEESRIDWTQWLFAVRIVPVVCLFATVVLQRFDTEGGGPVFQSFGRLLVAIGCAAFILGLVLDAPEARRFHAPWLRFFSEISYAVYLTHLTVLGLMHGLLLDSAPDVGTMAQCAVTVAAIPVTLGVAWMITKFVEQPVTAWGRAFAWR